MSRSSRTPGRATTLAAVAAFFAVAACAGDRAPTPPSAGENAALESITAEGILDHIRVLSDDSLEGRAPGTPGEDKTIAYLTAQFKDMGLAPGNPDGSYIQEVGLLGITGKPTASFSTKGGTVSLAFPNDYVAVTRQDKPVIDVSSDIVFVGYGVVAPEYSWDDYKDVDVRGKTIVMLINDPAVPDPNDPSKLDASIFKGDAMTYYGRWTYKYEIASVKGASAAVIIHETGPAGYPFEVVSGSWGRENFDIVSPDGNAGRVPVESWITFDKAQELFSKSGLNLDSLRKAATRSDFRPVSLGATATFHIENSRRRVQSKNVVGVVEGSDPGFRNEYVIYTAHWDHLGMDPTLPGDQIYNGAADNASGTASLLEIAHAYTKLAEKPKRSIMFLAVTAEEQGLLGAKYFAENPLVPLDHVLANINIDVANTWGSTSDITVVGLGNSTLDDILADVLKPMKRTLIPDPEPGKGFFYRSDHFEFAKKGVPALYTDAGVTFIGKPAGYGEEKRNEYTEKDYHKPSDDIKPDWDLSGAVDDSRALMLVGLRVANGTDWPEWKAGTEFKAIRDSVIASKR